MPTQIVTFELPQNQYRLELETPPHFVPAQHIASFYRHWNVPQTVTNDLKSEFPQIVGESKTLLWRLFEVKTVESVRSTDVPNLQLVPVTTAREIHPLVEQLNTLSGYYKAKEESSLQVENEIGVIFAKIRIEIDSLEARCTSDSDKLSKADKKKYDSLYDRLQSMGDAQKRAVTARYWQKEQAFFTSNLAKTLVNLSYTL